MEVSAATAPPPELPPPPPPAGTAPPAEQPAPAAAAAAPPAAQPNLQLDPTRFRSATLSRQADGALGLVVRERDGGVFVDGFTNAAVEVAARGAVRPGDRVVAVDGAHVAAGGRRHLKELLARTRDPVSLLLYRGDMPAAAAAAPPAPPLAGPMGPLNVVLARARADVGALFAAYGRSAFARWQLQVALHERLPQLSGRPRRTLRQGAARATDAQDRASPDARQRLLLSMLARGFDARALRQHVLCRDPAAHLAPSGYALWVAGAQDRLRELHAANGGQPCAVDVHPPDVKPLPEAFARAGFARARCAVVVERTDDDQYRAVLTHVEIAHAPPDDATGLQSAVVDFPLRRLKPYLELVGLGLADACLGTVEKRRRAPAPADDAEMPAAKQQKGDLG